MEISIERNGCISCGLCVATCPAVFRFADDGLAEAYRQPTDETAADAKAAAEGCPVSVIYVSE